MLKILREHRPVRFSSLAAILWSSVLLFSSAIAKAQEKIDLDVVRRIHDAAFNHSQVMNMVGYLTDVIGPRLTGSPNLKRAQEYTRDRLRKWGLANAHLEEWGPFGRGWSLEGFEANMISPNFSPLIAYPKAWSPSTDTSLTFAA
jgi:carboxypeptidase Q